MFSSFNVKLLFFGFYLLHTTPFAPLYEVFAAESCGSDSVSCSPQFRFVLQFRLECHRASLCAREATSTKNLFSFEKHIITIAVYSDSKPEWVQISKKKNKLFNKRFTTWALYLASACVGYSGHDSTNR